MKKILIGALVSFALMANGQTPVEKYGQLQIKNGKVSDKNGNPVVLRGMSMFWSGYPEGTSFYNAATIQSLKQDWCVDVVRAAMSVETGNTNYVSNGASEVAKIKTVIDACIANGLYVVVDFHTHNAPNYLNQAKAFFTDIANSYKNVPNILYEPYNEPISQDWSSQIKPYHNTIIQTIRAIDPDNIIICGTKTFSQDVDEAANDQVTGTNIAYTLHYYANTHKYSLRQKCTNALNKGVAIFVTEYGTCDADGNGPINTFESNEWWKYLEDNKISHCNWAVANKNETSSAISGSSSLSSSSQLTASGTLVRNFIKSKCGVISVNGSVTLSLAGNKLQYNIGEAVAISAATTVSNGTISKVEFYDGATLIAPSASTSSPYTLSVSNLTPGGHVITAKSFTGTTLIAVSPAISISVVGVSNIATTGITDQFETVTQFSELTGGVIGVSGNSCVGVGTAPVASAAGVYWFEDTDPVTPFKSKATRLGNGKLQYVISQAAGEYNVVGFNFGVYCDAGVIKKYALDLTNNAVLKLTINAPTTNIETLDVKFQLKDADGTVIAINKKVIRTDGTIDQNPATTLWYQYEIGLSKNHVAPDFIALAPGATTVFEFDFKNALSVKNPNSPDFPSAINLNNTDFDFSKVVEVIIIPLNVLDNKGKPDYKPFAFNDQTIIFSGLSLGNAAAGVDFCITPPAPKTSAAIPYCQNAIDGAEVTAVGVDGFDYKWYTSATGGVGSLVAPIPATAVAGTIKYFVSQIVKNSTTCEGPRTEQDVVIVEAPKANAGTTQASAVGPEVTLTGTGSAVGVWTSVDKQAGTTIAFTPSATGASVKATGLSKVGKYTFNYTVAGASPCTVTASTVEVNVTSVLSVEDEFLNSNIEMYPNPVSDNLFINMSKVNGAKSLKLVDMLGKTMFESANTENVTIPMNNLHAGMYIVQVQTASGILTKTIVKK